MKESRIASTAPPVALLVALLACHKDPCVDEPGCKKAGECSTVPSAMNGQPTCSATNDSDCKKSDECASLGRCEVSFVGHVSEGCFPKRAAECEQSTACKDEGRCKLVTGAAACNSEDACGEDVARAASIWPGGGPFTCCCADHATVRRRACQRLAADIATGKVPDQEIVRDRLWDADEIDSGGGTVAQHIAQGGLVDEDAARPFSKLPCVGTPVESQIRKAFLALASEDSFWEGWGAIGDPDVSADLLEYFAQKGTPSAAVPELVEWGERRSHQDAGAADACRQLAKLKLKLGPG